MYRRWRLPILVATLLACLVPVGAQTPRPLKVVGVLGNTSGMSDLPFPYAFYSGIAADAKGRLYFAGAAQGIPVSDQDGNCLAILRLPEGEGLVPQSRMVRAGDYVFCVAGRAHPFQGALYRVDTRAEDAKRLVAERLASAPGHWALSPTLDAAGRVVVGRSEIEKHLYTVTAYEPGTGQATELFAFALPDNAAWPWIHTIQAEPDGTISVTHRGVADVHWRFSPQGERVGEALDGQVIDGFRYFFGYHGGIIRRDLQGKDAPGECGSEVPEIRMAQQMVRVDDRYFFAGRGGAVEAKWNGTTFVYHRRLGALHIQEMTGLDEVLQAAAFTESGNNDVEHPLEIPKTQPLGQLLISGSPFYGKHIVALAPAPFGYVAVYRQGGEFHVAYFGPQHLAYDIRATELQDAGQAAVLGQDLLVADPKSGTIWRRPLMDKGAPLTPWRTELPGVVGLAVGGEGLFVATATQVSRLSPDGRQVQWTAPVTYQGIRRLAATPDKVYVCDTAGAVVDQLDAQTGALQARARQRHPRRSAVRPRYRQCPDARRSS